MQSPSHNASAHLGTVHSRYLGSWSLLQGPEEEVKRKRKKEKPSSESRKIGVLLKREKDTREVDGERDRVGKEKRTLGFRKYYLVSTDNDTLASYLRPSSIINPTHQSRYPDPTVATADRDVSLSR